MAAFFTQITEQPLSLDAHLAHIADPSAGAEAVFVGRIRNHDPEAHGEVSGIDYSHHPDAATILASIVNKAVVRLDVPASTRIAVSHRVGRLNVGDVALICCVSTPHRQAAFKLCRTLVEDIKAELPIWKQQFEASGRAVWSELHLDEIDPESDSD